jgi:hypothetical protein
MFSFRITCLSYLLPHIEWGHIVFTDFFMLHYIQFGTQYIAHLNITQIVLIDDVFLFFYLYISRWMQCVCTTNLTATDIV